MPLTDRQLNTLDRHYFDIIVGNIQNNIAYIISRFQRGEPIKNQWLNIAFEKKTNLFDKPVERMVRWSILKDLHWDYLPIPVSSDECFELDDAIIHIDAKTQLGTELYDVVNPNLVNINQNIDFKHIIISRNQTSLPATTVPFRNGNIQWNPNLPEYYNFGQTEKPCLTYFIRFTYNMICPNCDKIQDIGQSNQRMIKQHVGGRLGRTNKYLCCPYGTNTYSKANTCRNDYDYPSYRLDDVTIYSMPNGQLIRTYYVGNWFANMCYKSSITRNNQIVGISSARLKVSRLNRPDRQPTWWANNWTREQSINMNKTIIIQGS